LEPHAVAARTAAEIARVVDAAHDRGARVTAHAGRLSGAREGVRGGVDAIEHGFELDDELAAEMAERGTFLVSTLAVMRSWLTFGRTTTLPRFAAAEGRRAIEARLERAGIATAVVREALADLPSEQVRARQLVRGTPDRGAAWRLLGRRGYAPETIEDVVGGLDEEA
jgi:hypothetical protein